MKYLLILLVLFQLNQIKCDNDALYRVKRVIGGQPDNSSDYGFLAALIGTKGYSWDKLNIWGEYENVYCGGSLVAPNWILTAAHCFSVIKNTNQDDNANGNYAEDDDDGDDNNNDDDNEEMANIKYKPLKKEVNIVRSPSNYTIQQIIDFRDPKYWKVRLSVKKLKPSAQEVFVQFWKELFGTAKKKLYYKVEKIIPHPSYLPWNLEYDVALLKLKDNVDISNSRFLNIHQVPDNIKWPKEGDMCKVIGWGCNEEFGPLTDKPNSVNLPVISAKLCRALFRSDINLTETKEFCAGYYRRNIGICPGDSGSPLICHEDGLAKLAGVVSAAHIYEPNKYPGIITRISYFKNWLLETIKNN